MSSSPAPPGNPPSPTSLHPSGRRDRGCPPEPPGPAPEAPPPRGAQSPGSRGPPRPLPAPPTNARANPAAGVQLLPGAAEIDCSPGQA